MRPETPKIERLGLIAEYVKQENENIENIKSQMSTEKGNKDKEEKTKKKKIYQYREKAQNYQNKEKAIIFFQRLLRGRAIQNNMFDGKQKRLALIQELLIVNDTKPLSEEEKKIVLMKNHEEIAKDAMLEAIQGDVITKTLDLLSKELIRFKHKK